VEVTLLGCYDSVSKIAIVVRYCRISSPNPFPVDAGAKSGLELSRQPNAATTHSEMRRTVYELGMWFEIPKKKGWTTRRRLMRLARIFV
jgi:hypothetical protein